jgi:hypothetical protein
MATKKETEFTLRSNDGFEKAMKDIQKPCEIIAEVQFHNKDRNIVAVFDIATFRFLENSALKFEIKKPEDVLKKGIKKIPIFEYGRANNDALSLAPKYIIPEKKKKKGGIK